MATIRIADKAGACFGVERAMKLVEETAARCGSVCTLGPLIHNPQVVAALEERGVHAVSSVEDTAGSTIVLRTHGVTPAEEARAREICPEVIDATCPFVKKVHRAAERLADKGFEVVVVGEKGHPEVVATLAHAAGSRVISSPDEVRAANLGPRVGIVVQTTLSAAVLHAVVDAIDDGSREVELVNTICEATSQRQAAAAALAAESDAMIVIGGRNSANTTHLYEICAGICPKTFHIEQACELDRAWFDGCERIGVTAGASTPATHIASVCAAIEALVEEA